MATGTNGTPARWASQAARLIGSFSPPRRPTPFGEQSDGLTRSPGREAPPARGYRTAVAGPEVDPYVEVAQRKPVRVGQFVECEEDERPSQYRPDQGWVG